ncbi:hypothetical protein BRYFOR_07062 [Marvinbryantia formatexigens DSM 14469]|uniref:Uncharacterized protein n=1 Tax=Marvinbryantia formatexigens DSM 14469 TaxID=478749 RepID=C6LEL2_9FIRM|nr:hypothetical protein BRYFOR_07062 [Marvinbryantia formatexigens DSM 14469]
MIYSGQSGGKILILASNELSAVLARVFGGRIAVTQKLCLPCPLFHAKMKKRSR